MNISGNFERRIKKKDKIKMIIIYSWAKIGYSLLYSQIYDLFFYYNFINLNLTISYNTYIILVRYFIIILLYRIKEGLSLSSIIKKNKKQFKRFVLNPCDFTCTSREYISTCLQWRGLINRRQNTLLIHSLVSAAKIWITVFCLESCLYYSNTWTIAGYLYTRLVP